MEKSILSLLALVLFSSAVSAQNNNPREFEMTEGDTTYIMKQYIFCLYLSGENRSQDKEEAAKIQAAHMSHINNMTHTHNLQVAGPLGDDSEKRGILIFDLETVEEAETAMKNDPAVEAGRLTYECHPWWAAKGTQLK